MGLFNKLNELRAIVALVEPDIIGVTETHFLTTIPSATYHLPGYILYRADRVLGSHGGSAFYIKSSLSASVSGIHVHPMGEWESIWCTVVIPQVTTIELSCIYRIPSNSLPDHWDSFFSNLLHSPATKPNCSVLIMGDFNFPSIDWHTQSTSQSDLSASFKFLDFLQENCLNQAVIYPTRHRTGQKSSLLDLIISTSDLSVTPIIHNAPLGKSDHDVLLFSVEISFSVKPTKLIRRNFRNADYILFNHIISTIDWEAEFFDLDVNTQLDILNSFLLDIIQTFVPVSTTPTSQHSPWINQNVRSLVNKKKRTYRTLRHNPIPSNLAAYKVARNEAVAGIRSAKGSYERNLILRAKQQPKALYSYLNSVKKTQPATCLKNSDGSIITDDLEIANKLNTFFCSTALPITNFPCISSEKGTVEFCQNDVEQALLHLKDSTSCQPFI
jgi:hypothetical protein